MKLLYITPALLILAACATPEPICNREAQQWNKFDTIEDVCEPPVVATPWLHQSKDDKEVQGVSPEAPDSPSEEPDDVSDPTTPDEPDTPTGGPEVEPDEPTQDKPKSDNSDANGKGGNKHDREDKTKNGTEVAEDKKDV